MKSNTFTVSAADHNHLAVAAVLNGPGGPSADPRVLFDVGANYYQEFLHTISCAVVGIKSIRSSVLMNRHIYKTTTRQQAALVSFRLNRRPVIFSAPFR